MVSNKDNTSLTLVFTNVGLHLFVIFSVMCIVASLTLLWSIC